MGTGDYHGGEMGVITGSPHGGQRDHTVHKSTRDHAGHIADPTFCNAFLDGQKTAAEAVGISHTGIDSGGLHSLEYSCGLPNIGG